MLPPCGHVPALGMDKIFGVAAFGVVPLARDVVGMGSGALALLAAAMLDREVIKRHEVSPTQSRCVPECDIGNCQIRASRTGLLQSPQAGSPSRSSR